MCFVTGAVQHRAVSSPGYLEFSTRNPVKKRTTAMVTTALNLGSPVTVSELCLRTAQRREFYPGRFLQAIHWKGRGCASAAKHDISANILRNHVRLLQLFDTVLILSNFNELLSTQRMSSSAKQKPIISISRGHWSQLLLSGVKLTEWKA